MPHYSWLKTTFERISEDATADRLAHALLISGIEGIGVPEFAGEIATYRLCFNAASQDAKGGCGQCKACALLSGGTHPDLQVLELEAAAQMIKVDQVRGLVNFMSQTPQIGDWKVVIIRSAHRMNHNAANALLKVLEEPPGQSLLLLATERPQVLLPTVRSRCTQVRLPGPNEAQAREYLSSIGIDAVAAAEATAKLGLKPLQIAEWIKTDLMTSWKLVSTEIQALEARESSAVKAAMALKGMDITLLINWLIEDVVAKMKASFLLDNKKLKNLKVFERYEQVYDLLIKTKQTLDSGANPNPQLALESIFLDWPVRVN